MAVGVLVRTEARGLSYQSRAWVRHLDGVPLVVSVPNRSAHVCPEDRSLFPGAPVARVRDGWRLDEAVTRDWLASLNGAPVLTAETAYDDRLGDWCRAAGCTLTIAANPEFVPASLAGYGLGRPDRWWSHTSWRQEHMPPGTRVVPFPVEPAEQVEPHDGPARFVHVEGRRAIGDRNGTELLIAAVRLLRAPCSLRIVTQEPDLPARVHHPPHVAVEVTTGGVVEPDDLYRGADVLVLPRRYGGLCLPTQEAMARGMAVVMPACPPNVETWPVLPVPAEPGAEVATAAGLIPTHAVTPEALASAMDSLADPTERHRWQASARSWAVAHSWKAWAPIYRELLDPSTSPAASR